MIWLLLLISFWSCLEGKISLICKKAGFKDASVYNINVEVVEASKFGLLPSEPYVYDKTGKRFTSSHLSVSSSSDFACIFAMNSYIITSGGAIFQAAKGLNSWNVVKDNQVFFDHPTMCGFTKTTFLPMVNAAMLWNYNVATEGKKFISPAVYNESDAVIALRMPFDGCFNHFSFQALPMIGAVNRFLKSEWSTAKFHCCKQVASILNILDIPMERLIIESPVYAKRVILPWIPKWLPVQTSSLKGIYSVVSRTLTSNLLEKKFDSSIYKSLNPLVVSSPSHPEVSVEELLSPNDPYRYIVYNSRVGQSTRTVYKEDQLLKMLSKVINKSKYRLVVTGINVEYNVTELIQASWQRLAKIYSKAIVMMGPHGGAFNNMIFTPSDTHVIEFNHFPDEKYNIGATMARPCFVAGFHAKGGSGKYYTIEPNNVTSTTPPVMYSERFMKVSQRDVLLTLMQINRHIPNHDLLVENINILDIPELSPSDLRWKPQRNSKTSSTSIVTRRSQSKDRQTRTEFQGSRERRNGDRFRVKPNSITLS